MIMNSFEVEYIWYRMVYCQHFICDDWTEKKDYIISAVSKKIEQTNCKKFWQVCN